MIFCRIFILIYYKDLNLFTLFKSNIFIHIDTNNWGLKVTGPYKVPDRKHSGRQKVLKALRSQ